MKSKLYKILKIFLITLAVILLTLLVLGLVFTLNWPWWVSIFLFIGIFFSSQPIETGRNGIVQV